MPGHPERAAPGPTVIGHGVLQVAIGRASEFVEPHSGGCCHEPLQPSIHSHPAPLWCRVIAILRREEVRADGDAV